MNYEELLAKLKTDLPAVQPIFPAGFAFWLTIGLGVIVLVLGFIAFLMWVMPLYGVWNAHKAGLADLAQSENEQKVQIMMAQARLDAATKNKAAAIIEAEAVAAQIEKIGANLQRHDLYLKWQWIKMMEDHSDQATIYIPTEAGLPILEAGKAVRARQKEADDDNS